MFVGSTLILFVLILIDLTSVVSPCSSTFNRSGTDAFCYHYDSTERTWTDAYDFCRTSLQGGNLLEILTSIQWKDLTNLPFNQQSVLWIGANHFGRDDQSEWHWLEGSIVDPTITPWCFPQLTTTGSDCLAYDSNLKCVRPESCQRSLSVICAPDQIVTQIETSVQKSLVISRQTSSATCGTVYSGSYGSWWTYAMLLLNWFALFCFVNYLIYRLLMNKRAAFVIIVIGILSLISIIAFAVLWALQYKDLTRLPLAVVVVGSFAGLILLVIVFILISNRLQVRRFLACRIVTMIATIIQCGLMAGVAICFAFCTGYISLGSTVIEKDIIASILASIIPAISIIFFTIVLYLIGHPNDDRLRSSRSNTINNRPAITTNQREVNRLSNSTNNVVVAQRSDRVERATSPVDARILEEFYSDRPREMHSYQLDGRRYVVFEGKTLTELDSLRRELTQAILSHDSHALREATSRAKRSVYATALAEEIERAEDLIKSLPGH